MDGPAHLYNARVIKEMLLADHEKLDSFYRLNGFPVPNWTGHFLLSAFLLFLPAYLAEKGLLLIYLVGLPLSFRTFIQTVSPDRPAFSYFIFPFTFSFLFTLGFYNFSLGLILFFTTLSYWNKVKHRRPEYQRMFTLFLFFTVTYFTHIFILAALLILIGLDIILPATHRWIRKKEGSKALFEKTLDKTRLFLLPSLPLIVLSLFYTLNMPGGDPSFMDTRTLIEDLSRMKGVISYQEGIEEPYTRTLFYLFCALTLFGIFKRIGMMDFPSLIKGKGITERDLNIRSSDLWLFSALLFLGFYFILPESTGSAGAIVQRVRLFFFLLLIVWFAASKGFPKWLKVASVALLLYCHFNLLSFYRTVAGNLNEVALDCQAVAEQLPADSIVLPLHYSGHWLTGHFPNYVGVDKPMVILENYEAATGYFPLKWNKKGIPDIRLGTYASSDLPCKHWMTNEKNAELQAGHVLVFGKKLKKKEGTCHDRIRSILDQEYKETLNNDHCTLYTRKKKGSP